MDTDVTTQAPPHAAGHRRDLDARLVAAWHKQREFVHVRGLCYFLVWAVALVLLDLLLDWLLGLPGYARLLLLGVNIGALGWVVYARWWRYLEKYDPVRLALRIEGLHPDLKSLLVSYVQFTGATAREEAVSPALIEAVRRQAVERTSPINFREIASFRELKRIFILSGVCLLFFGATSVRGSEFLRILVLRMLNPTTGLAYPTKTQITGVTGNVTVQHGAGQRLAARTGGLVPAEGRLFFRTLGGDWEKVTLPQVENEFAYQFKKVYQDFEYQFRIGDARSDVHRVEVVPPPRIVEPVVTLRFPAYMGAEDKPTNALTIQVPAGTLIQWQLRMDQALTRAVMTRGEDSSAADAEMQLDPGGMVARARTVAETSFPYRFRWEEKAHGYQYDEKVRYFVRSEPDAPPQVSLVEPSRDEKATAGKTLRIVFRARDKYGLSKAWIVFKVNGGPEQRRLVTTPMSDPKSTETTESWKLAESVPNLKEGDAITYAVEVADNRTDAAGAPAPNLGRSTSRSIAILSANEYLRYILDSRSRLTSELEPLYEQERQASEEIKALKDHKGEKK